MKEVDHLAKSIESFQKNPWLILSMIIFISSLLMGYGQLDWLGISGVTWQVLGLFIACLILWLKVAIDWPSLLCLIGLGLLPNLSYAEVFQLSFGNTTFVFLFFTFIVTYALEQTHALKRVIGWAMNSHWAQTSTSRLILAFLSALLLLATFISPTILFMIAFPLYEEIMKQLGLEKSDRRASLLLIALFATLAIGTAMTPINHVFAITAMGIYTSATGIPITNGQYMSLAVPTGLALFLGLLLSLRWIFQLDLSDIKLNRVESLADLPPMDRKEKWILLIFLLVIAMWLVPEMMGSFFPALSSFFKSAGIAFPPMVGTLLLTIIHIDDEPLIHLPEAIRKGVYWPSLLIVAATLSIGSVLSNPDYGVTALFESALTPLLASLTPILIIAFFVSWAGLQTNFASNLVTSSMVTTIMTTVISADPNLQISATTLACLIGFMASLALMTPPAMPYVAISIGSGWTNSRDCLLYGGWILFLGILSAILIGYPIGNLILQ